MMKISSILISSTTVLLGVMLLCSPIFKQTPAKADSTPSTSDLKALYQEKCSACHDAYDPTEKDYTKAQWQSTVDRMMNAHNARATITDDQAAQIVTYLDEFAAKPDVNNGTREIGIWQSDPVQSVDYPFTYPPNLQYFDSSGGVWRIVSTADGYSGYLKGFAANSSPCLLVENKNTFQGALDLQYQFQVVKGSPVGALGLVFGGEDSKNYFAAEYNPSTGVVSISQVENGSSSVLQQSTVLPAQSAIGPTWHILRVKVNQTGSKAEIWLDYQKQLTTSLPQWSGGRVGIVSLGPLTAEYRQMTIDTYQSVNRSPAGDILLH